MKTLHKILLATTLLALGLPTAQAQSTTFDFSVVYGINNTGQFSSAFPGAAVSQFTTPGLYEETDTALKTVLNVGTNSTTAPAINTIFAQNASPTDQLVFTSFGTNASQYFPGFPLSGTNPPNSSSWQYVQTLSTTNASFVNEVGGTTTQFSLNSIGLANLQNGPSISVTIEGFLGGSLVATQSFSPTAVGGNGNAGPPPVPASVNIFALTNPGFGDVDKIEVLPFGSNANVNDITIGAPVPEPSPWSMIAVGGVALVGVMLRKKHRIA